MSEADQRPTRPRRATPQAGRRRAEPSRRARKPRPRRLAPVEEVGQEAPPRDRSPEPRSPRIRRAQVERTLLILWLALVVAVTGVLVADRVHALPDVAREVAAAAQLTLFAGGLAVRTGGRPWWALVLGAGLGAAAFVADWDPLRAGAAVGTAVLAGCLAVMATVPARTFQLAVREALVATAIAAAGAVGTRGFLADGEVRVQPERFGYVVLALGLVGALMLVFRLGAGLHGLGRRGYVLAGTALLFIAIALAYTEALSQWGSRDLVTPVDEVRAWCKEHLHAVPHPIAALLGYPALAWGVFMRARRRQGWWVCAFGVAATASAATRLTDPTVGIGATLLGGLYSILVGLVLGYLAIRVEQAVSGSHGRRARRTEEAAAHRPEPGRLEPLH